MTDKEKIEKLLDFIYEFFRKREDIHCDAIFDNYDKKWCEEHCQWCFASKECFRHFLLGE